MRKTNIKLLHHAALQIIIQIAQYGSGIAQTPEIVGAEVIPSRPKYITAAPVSIPRRYCLI